MKGNMKRYTIRKQYEIEYAHQLYDSFSVACHETIHGHSGIIELFLSSDSLDETQMVIDFGALAPEVKSHLMEKYDHALFMPVAFNESDPEYIETLRKFNKKLVITPVNPTAEKFAEMIYYEVITILTDMGCQHIHVDKVRFHETRTGYAEYSFG